MFKTLAVGYFEKVSCHFEPPIVIATEGRNPPLGTGSGRKLIQSRMVRFLAPLEMTEGGSK